MKTKSNRVVYLYVVVAMVLALTEISWAAGPNIEMVYVKGGCYQMGDTFGDGNSDEKPAHEACVDDFYIGKFVVTQAQWQAVMGTNPSSFKECGPNCPVENVSWDDVQDYINKLNEQTGQKYRLLTEAEWEYAARSGGRHEKWAGTSDFHELENYAWFENNSEKKTHPVGRKNPNGLELYDMTGDVWEWLNDRYDKEYYKNSPRMNPHGVARGAFRVIRGGGWFDPPVNVRAAIRYHRDTGFRYFLVGFRLARTP
jgi:formylglycine-generating enzyme